MDKVAELQAHTGFWLRMVSNAVSQDFARKIADEGVTAAEWVCLRALYDAEEMSPSALAAKLGMTKGAISKLADRLLEKQLVRRRGDPADRRAQRLSLTKEGRGKVPVLAALADKNDTEYFGVLTGEEHEILRNILNVLVERRRLTKIPVD